MVGKYVFRHTYGKTDQNKTHAFKTKKLNLMKHILLFKIPYLFHVALSWNSLISYYSSQYSVSSI